MVGRHRLVTVTGTGGAGKTRLVLAAADVVADQFADGAWFVELGEVHDAADLASAVATTLSLQPVPGTDGTATTVAALASQHTVLLLDNCEQLIGAVVELVDAIESRCPRVTVLATSREALGLVYEDRLTLQPLAVDGDGGPSEAARLFHERAAAVLGGFAPSDADAVVIDDICRQLDGLPLAIELATARLSTMSVGELRSHLDDRFQLLARRRGVSARQQSLRAAVAWSYDLLTDPERLFFDQVSMLRADFGPGAARAVGGDSSVPVEDLLLSLVDKSLLISMRGPLGTRFRLLETLRQYGESRLDADGTALNMRRQLDYYVAWTAAADAGIKGPDELLWHQGFTAEWPNIRNAFRWACRVDDGDAASRLVAATLWWAKTRMRLEADQWCHVVLDLPSAASHRLRPVLAPAPPSSPTCVATTRVRNVRSTSPVPRRSGSDGPRSRGSTSPPPTTGPAVRLARSPRRPRCAVEWKPPPLTSSGTCRRRSRKRTSWPSSSARRATHARRRGRPHRPHQTDRRAGRDARAAQRHRRRPDPAGHGVAIVRAGRRGSALLEDALDLCIPLGVAEYAHTARCELASHYTQLGRPREALALIRTTIPDHVRVGAWHEVYAALAHIAQALADLGRPRVAATILGRLGTGTSELNQTFFGFQKLHDELVADLGAAELATLIAESRSRTLTDLAQLVIETIDEVR